MTEPNKQGALLPETKDGFDCNVCNKHHDILPRSMAFALPDFINKMLPWDREKKVQMSEDWAIVDGKFFYLRGCLEVPIENNGGNFVWGVWVTLSMDDFDQTMELWENPERVNEPEYNGTIANTMPSYQETRGLKVRIKTRAVGERPLVLIDDVNHKLYDEQNACISRAEVIELAKFVLHGGEDSQYGHLCEK